MLTMPHTVMMTAATHTMRLTPATALRARAAIDVSTPAPIPQAALDMAPEVPRPLSQSLPLAGPPCNRLWRVVLDSTTPATNAAARRAICAPKNWLHFSFAKTHFLKFEYHLRVCRRPGAMNQNAKHIKSNHSRQHVKDPDYYYYRDQR